MAKKLFLNMERDIPTVQLPFVNRLESDSEAPSCGRNCLVSETTKQQRFLILDEISKSFPTVNAPGRSMIIKISVAVKSKKLGLS